MLKTIHLLLYFGVLGLLAACSDSADTDKRGTGSGGGSSSSADPFDSNSGSGGTGSSAGGNVGDWNGETGCFPSDASMWFVIDGSGSMRDDFGGNSRWNTLRSALMDPDGAIMRLQDIVEFGMVLYDGPIDIASFIPGVAPSGNCPQIITVPVGPMNFGPIDMAYPQDPLGGSTPTHYGMEAVRMAIQAELAQPDEPRTHYIILATDGEPNSFCDNSGADAAAAVVQQTMGALAEGVQTFVISLASGDAALNAHLNEVAIAGGTGTTPFVPDSKDALVETLREIVTGATGCDLLAPD